VTFILLLLCLQDEANWDLTLNLFKYQWIILCVSTGLTLLLLLFNLARGLWILYSRKIGRWSMRVQHMDNRSGAESGPENFFEVLRRLIRAFFGQYLFRKRFK